MSDKVSRIVVGAVMGAGLVWSAFYLLGIGWGMFATGLLAWEAFTLVNHDTHDTLSEQVWLLAKRPMVPWLFGLATGIGLGINYLSDPYVTLALGFLSGHFFFQRHDDGL